MGSGTYYDVHRSAARVRNRHRPEGRRAAAPRPIAFLEALSMARTA